MSPTMNSKRPRSSSPSSSRSSASTPSPPSSKLIKIIPDLLYTSLTCSLPPTCSYPHQPTPLSSTHDVEEHYTKYHTHVCEYERCKTVFPDARFLELHFAECHDPIIALGRERGEKTFACYLATCSRLFVTPKGRRLHLIQAHGYPKQYFFAVTNKGIGGLLDKWGQGASLYRGDWKPRVKDHTMKNGSDSGDESRGESGSEMEIENQLDGRQRPPHMEDHRLMLPKGSPTSPSISLSPARPHEHTSPESDALTNAMSSLTLVPDKIRFGRGGKKGGFSRSHLTKLVKSDRTGPSESVTANVEEKHRAVDQKSSNCKLGGRSRRRTQRKTGEFEGASASGDPDPVASSL